MRLSEFIGRDMTLLEEFERWGEIRKIVPAIPSAAERRDAIELIESERLDLFRRMTPRDKDFVTLQAAVAVLSTAAVGSEHLKRCAEGILLGPIAGSVREGEPEGLRWHVVIIESGVSKNRNRYRPEVLEAGRAKYEGVPVFWDHQRDDQSSRSARDLAGFIGNVTTGPYGATFALSGVLSVTSRDLRQSLLDAHAAGKPELYGLSHDARVEYVTVSLPDGTAVRDVTSIEEVLSVDVVAHPAASGRVLAPAG